MSISNIRKMIEHKGCQAGLVVIGVLSLVGLAGVGTFRGMFGGLTGADKPVDQTPPVLELGSVKMTEGQYQTVFNASMEQAGQLANQDPDFRLQFMAQAANSLARQAAVKAIAAEKKVSLDDKAVLAMVDKSVDGAIAQSKDMLLATGKLKPDASAAEVAEALKQQFGGHDTAELRKAQIDNAKNNLADPVKRDLFLTAATLQALTDAEAAQHPVSDERLKKDFDKFLLDQVPFQDSTVPVEERKALAAKALADAKAGKTIEEIRKTYAPKESTAPVTQTRAALDLDPNMKAIENLKVGEWSDVIMLSGSPVIYRVAKIEPGLPPDFEKNTAKYRDSHSTTLAQKAVGEQIDAKVKQVKWLSAGLELCIQYVKETTDRDITADTGKRKEALQKLYADAKALAGRAVPTAQTDPSKQAFSSRLDDEAAALVRNAVSKQLYSLATPVEQDELAKGRLEDLTAVFQFVDSGNLRLDAVDIALKAKDEDAVAENILEAARSLGRPDPMTEAAYTNIRRKLDELKAGKKIPDAAAQKAEDALSEYLKEKIEVEKDEADRKKLDEERAKEQKAEEDKAKAGQAAADKNRKPDDAKKPATTGSGQPGANPFLTPETGKGG